MSNVTKVLIHKAVNAIKTDIGIATHIDLWLSIVIYRRVNV